MERLYDQKEMQYERKTYKMMPLKLETEEEKVEYELKDAHQEKIKEIK